MLAFLKIPGEVRFGQSQFRGWEKNPAQNHRFEQSLLPGSSQAGQEAIQAEAPPGVNQHGQPAIVLGIGEFEVVNGNQGFAPEAGGDEFADLLGQVADVADGAGAWALWGAEGLADLMGDIA